MGANARLDAKGLVAFDPRNEADRARAIERTIGVSLDLLDQSERARFSELGIFPEDADIPLGVAGRLWDETGGLNEFETEDVLSRLYDLSLLLNLDLNQRLLRLHDTVRHFLEDQDGKDGLIAQHKRLLLALGDIGTSTSADALTRRYSIKTNATRRRRLSYQSWRRHLLDLHRLLFEACRESLNFLLLPRKGLLLLRGFAPAS